MIVKAIYKDKEHDYFRDKTTGEQIEKQEKRHYGDIFECDDDLAIERIKKKLVKKATKEEEKAYLDSIDNNDDGDVIKSLNECTKEELIKVAFEEDICIDEQMSEEQLMETINKVRAERLKQLNND